MHWHPNADEWAYFLKGSACVTVFDTGPAAVTADFHAGEPIGQRDYTAKFHPLAVRAILAGAWQPINYERVMRLELQLARWIATLIGIGGLSDFNPDHHAPVQSHLESLERQGRVEKVQGGFVEYHKTEPPTEDSRNAG